MIINADTPSTTAQESDLLLNELPNNKPKATGTVLSSTLNLMLSIIGAGTLAVPYAVAQSGIIVSTVLFIVIGIINAKTLSLNMECAATFAPSSSYNSLCKATIPRFKMFVDFTVFIATFGTLCAYLVVIGDLLPDAVETLLGSRSADAHFFQNRRVWIIIYLLLFILPTVAFKKMSALRFTSFFAMLCYGFMMCVTVVYAFNADNNLDIDKGKIEWYPSQYFNILRAFPFFVQIFSCHFNAFSICNELKQSSMHKLNIICFVTIFCSMIIYAVIGYAAYFTFGDLINSDILLFYPKTNSLLILRIALSISIAFGYPVIMQSSRNCASLILFKKRAKKLSNFTFYMLTYGIVFASLLISFITDNITQIFGLVGSTATIIIVFILPSIFYYNLPITQLQKTKSKFKLFCCVLFIVFGTLLIPFCVTMEYVK